MGELKSVSRKPRRWVRIPLVGLGIVVLAAATGGVGVYRITDARLTHRYDTGFSPPLTNGDSARGEHLATSVTICSKCHAADFGGQVMADNAIVRLAAPNLTSGTGDVRPPGPMTTGSGRSGMASAPTAGRCWSCRRMRMPP